MVGWLPQECASPYIICILSAAVKCELSIVLVQALLACMPIPSGKVILPKLQVVQKQYFYMQRGDCGKLCSERKQCGSNGNVMEVIW